MTMQPVGAMPIDADMWWIVYLRSVLLGRPESYARGVKVDRKVPKERPDRLVVVRRDGGVVSGFLDRPRVAFDVWAKTEQDATDLASLVTALALLAPGTNGCKKVEHLSGPNAVVESSGTPRRLSLIEATHRAAVLT